MAIHQYKSGGGSSPAPSSRPRTGKTGASCYDSLQPAARQSDLISAIRYHSTPFANPSRHYPPEVPPPPSLYSKLQGDIQQRFQRGQYFLARGPLLIFLSFVKIIYLAITVPIYFCCWELPRTIYRQLLFFCFRSVILPLRKVVGSIGAAAHRLIFPFVGFAGKVVSHCRAIAGFYRNMKKLLLHYSPRSLSLVAIVQLKSALSSLIRWRQLLYTRLCTIALKAVSQWKINVLALENGLRAFFSPIEQFLVRSLQNLLKSIINPILRAFRALHHCTVELPHEYLHITFSALESCWQQIKGSCYDLCACIGENFKKLKALHNTIYSQWLLFIGTLSISSLKLSGLYHLGSQFPFRSKAKLAKVRLAISSLARELASYFTPLLISFRGAIKRRRFSTLQIAQPLSLLNGFFLNRRMSKGTFFSFWVGVLEAVKADAMKARWNKAKQLIFPYTVSRVKILRDATFPPFELFKRSREKLAAARVAFSAHYFRLWQNAFFSCCWVVAWGRVLFLHSIAIVRESTPRLGQNRAEHFPSEHASG